VQSVASRRAQAEDGEGGGDFEVIIVLASEAMTETKQQAFFPRQSEQSEPHL